MQKCVQLSFLVLMLSVSACQSASETSAATAELRNTLWKLTVLDGKAVQTPEGQRMASLTLNAENTSARIATACNSGSAAFSLDGKQLKFGVAMSTKMMCPEAQIQQESAFFKAIADTTHYEVKGEILELYDAENKLLASFHSEYLK